MKIKLHLQSPKSICCVFGGANRLNSIGPGLALEPGLRFTQANTEENDLLQEVNSVQLRL